MISMGNVYAISVSRDHKWIVCGAARGASVWDGEINEKVIDMEGENIVVDSVDVSPDSTRFATGTGNGQASIWSITTGRRVVGPLELDDDWVSGVRFSPSGEHIATACKTSIRIFDSQTGDKLITIDTHTPQFGAATPIAWSSDGRQIFVASRDKFRAFDTSTGTQLAESQIPYDGVPSIALASNGKFIAALANRSVSFLDTSTLARIGPVIEDSEGIRSVAISPDSTRLATGRGDGKIIIRDLAKILPDSYGSFNVSICALPCSISHVDEICRYLLANKLNKMSSL